MVSSTMERIQNIEYIIMASCFFSAFIFTWIIKKVAIKKAIMDIPNERSSHTIPTPRGGGLAIAITWFAVLIALFLLNKIEDTLFWALMSGFLLVIVGIIDDVKSISPKFRLIVQALSASVALYFLNGFQYFDIGFLVIDAKIILTILAFFGILWFINLFNFLDGIDGYISTEAIFICIAAYLLTRNVVLLFLSTSILGFLIWNWQKAKIFMGDVGST
ncbi:MAG: glycosyl transferase, partial [bacterium]